MNYNLIENQLQNDKRMQESMHKDLQFAINIFNDFNIAVSRYNNHYAVCCFYYSATSYITIELDTDKLLYTIEFDKKRYILKKEQLKRFISIYKKYYQSEIYQELEKIIYKLKDAIYKELYTNCNFEYRAIKTELFEISFNNETREVIIDKSIYEYIYYKYQFLFDNYFMIFDIHNKKDFETYKKNIKKYEEYLKIIA